PSCYTLSLRDALPIWVPGGDGEAAVVLPAHRGGLPRLATVVRDPRVEVHRTVVPPVADGAVHVDGDLVRPVVRRLVEQGQRDAVPRDEHRQRRALRGPGQHLLTAGYLPLVRRLGPEGPLRLDLAGHRDV